MAIWQFTIYPISKESVQESAVSRVRLTRDEIDVQNPTFAGDEADELIRRFNTILPPAKHWSEDALLWGDLERDDIQAWRRFGSLTDVKIRLNVADLSLPLIDALCALGREYDWVFATAEGLVIQPERASLIRAIKNSKAAGFLKDPEGFLRRASAEYDAGRKPWWHFWGDGPKVLE